MCLIRNKKSDLSEYLSWTLKISNIVSEPHLLIKGDISKAKNDNIKNSMSLFYNLNEWTPLHHLMHCDIIYFCAFFDMKFNLIHVT